MFAAFLLFKALLILIIVGFLIRLIVPYLSLKFSGIRFKRSGTPGFKAVDEKKKTSKKKNVIILC